MRFRNSHRAGSRDAGSNGDSAAPLRALAAWLVGFLTPIAAIRRLFDGSSPLGNAVAAVLLLLGSAASAATAPNTAWHAIEDIRKTAENFVSSATGDGDERISPQAGRLDSRLHLPQCSEKLEAFQQRGAKITSRTIVGVRCNGSNPWKVYVPVDVMVTETVLITNRSLPAGHIFSAADVNTEPRDVSRLVGGYLSRSGSLVGKQLKHSLMAGRVITPSMLKANIMIRRGQSVTIVANGNAVNIQMRGTALSDGAENQRIRVENTVSKRVIEGIVRSPEHVEILVY